MTTRGRSGAVILTLLISACTLVQKSEPELGAAIELPSVRSRIVFLAEQEWRIFGEQVVTYYKDSEPRIEAGHAENEPPFLSRVLAYWQANTEVSIVDEYGRIRPWSAAFISWVLRQAGVRDDQFRFSVLHWDYIEAALDMHDSSGFRARDAALTAPRPGDLLCAPRDGTAALVERFADLQRGSYHCDIVVSASPQALDVIGGNVGDSVSRSRVELDVFGRVVKTPARPWVVVLSLGL